MHLPQILQPCHNFIITLPFIVNFKSKIYFLQHKNQSWTKSTLKSVPLVANWISPKKNFLGQNFSDFWLFLKFKSMVAKFETGIWFVNIFWTFWHLYWPWVCVCIEMGNLEAKTPCVFDCLEEGASVWLQLPLWMWGKIPLSFLEP